MDGVDPKKSPLGKPALRSVDPLSIFHRRSSPQGGNTNPSNGAKDEPLLRSSHDSLLLLRGVNRGIHLGTSAQKVLYSEPKLSRRVGSS